ncbi:MAG: ABC transporter ATP-binding protein, partial [Acidimicrobiales bacterium]
VERRGDVAALRCADSDATLRALLARHPAARDIEVVSAGLEDAFLALTDDHPSAVLAPDPQTAPNPRTAPETLEVNR